MTAALEWTHKVAALPRSVLATERSATAAECEEVARALDFPECKALAAAYELLPLSGRRFRAVGQIRASVTQTCVVTLDPIATEISDSFDVEFRPEDEMPGPAGQELEILSAIEFEPIENGIIDVGRVIVETLSVALDPYPRQQGPGFQWREPGSDDANDPDNPFAALARLKD